MTIPQNAWLADWNEMTAFGAALVGGGWFAEPSDLQYFYETPWKWTTFHEDWVAAGRPIAFTASEDAAT